MTVQSVELDPNDKRIATIEIHQPRSKIEALTHRSFEYDVGDLVHFVGSIGESAVAKVVSIELPSRLVIRNVEIKDIELRIGDWVAGVSKWNRLRHGENKYKEFENG